MTIRIIPRLDIKGPNLVKGIQLEGLRVLGKPADFARHYYEHGADELLYMDVVASLYERNSLSAIIEKTSQEIFIPLTVGGGIRTLEDIRTSLRSGADKVAINTAAVKNPDLISQAARCFGSSTIVVSIDAKKQRDGSYEVYTDNGRQKTGIDVFVWAQKVTEHGAGELMITSIDREGTSNGYDLELIRRISAAVPIPVISCGGAGCPEHVYDAIVQGQSDAVSMASILHYNSIRHLGGTSSHLGFGKATDIPLEDLKSYLAKRGIDVRPSFIRKDASPQFS
jgi:imidazole glycerol-phosphate synthase subunit HisF